MNKSSNKKKLVIYSIVTAIIFLSLPPMCAATGILKHEIRILRHMDRISVFMKDSSAEKFSNIEVNNECKESIIKRTNNEYEIIYFEDPSPPTRFFNLKFAEGYCVHVTCLDGDGITSLECFDDFPWENYGTTRVPPLSLKDFFTRVAFVSKNIYIGLINIPFEIIFGIGIIE